MRAVARRETETVDPSWTAEVESKNHEMTKMGGHDGQSEQYCVIQLDRSGCTEQDEEAQDGVIQLDRSGCTEQDEEVQDGVIEFDRRGHTE